MVKYVLRLYTSATPPANAAPTNISLSGTSIADNSIDGDVVGTITVTDADSASLNSLTVSNSKFKVANLSGLTAQLQRSAVGTLTPGISETLTLTATDSSGNPFTSDTKTITISDHLAETLIGIVTITNPTGSAKTNEPFTIGYPLSPTALGSNNIRVYDDNGAGAQGAVLSAYQWKLQSSDRNSKVRLGRISGIVPSIAGSATRKLHIYASPTPPPSGTDITAAAVLTTGIQFQAEYDIGGTVYTADVRSCLASTAFSKTAAWHSVFFAGPNEACFICHMPPVSGSVVHASGDGLHTEFHLYVSAVNGTIVRAICDVVTTNSDIARTAMAHYYYGLTIKRATSVSDSTLISTDDTDLDGNVIRYAYPRSQPAAILTATGATSTGAKTWTTSGVWAADIIGAHIVDPAGTGKAIVTARASDTSITAYVYAAFAATSYAAGSWTIEGIGHHYNVPFKRRAYVGTKPCALAWGDCNSAITPNSRAPMAYGASTKMLMNHGMAYASVTHNMTNLNIMRSSDGSIRPLTFRGNSATWRYLGDILTNVPEAGGRIDIGILPAWCVEGLIKYDANGRRKIFENADWAGTYNWYAPRRWSGSPVAGSLPCVPRSDNGTTYKWNTAYLGTQLVGGDPDSASIWWPYGRDASHMFQAFYLPYLLTCDYFYLDRLNAQVSWETNIQIADNYNGIGTEKTVFGAVSVGTHQFGNAQPRQKAWTARTVAQVTVITPDTNNDRLYNSKAYITTKCAKHWDAFLRYGSPTDINGYWTGTPKEPPYVSVIPWAGSSHSWDRFFQLEYLGWVFGHIKELGADDADFDTAAAWYLSLFTRLVALNGTDVVADYMANAYSWLFADGTYSDNSRPQSFAELYKRNALLSPQSRSDYGTNVRIPTGTLTINDNTVGAGRTFTFSNSYFGQGAWYVGGLIANQTDGGLAKITSVAGNVVTCDIITVFASPTPTIGNVRIPWAHPADYTGENNSASRELSYAQLFKNACESALICGVPGAQAARNYAVGRANYVEQNGFHHIDPR